ncbi:MAG: hypothetical protein KGI60_04245 [Patescibacteria group bacterium]|nr:hypothetical protein [Patescibacteria group bacterium]
MKAFRIGLCMALAAALGAIPAALADDQGAKPQTPYLIEYVETGCFWCHNVDATVRRLEREQHVTVRQFNITESSAAFASFYAWNEKFKGTHDQCLGVPYFVNTRTLATICGAAATYDQFKAWASDERKQGRR